MIGAGLPEPVADLQWQMYRYIEEFGWVVSQLWCRAQRFAITARSGLVTVSLTLEGFRYLAVCTARVWQGFVAS